MVSSSTEAAKLGSYTGNSPPQVTGEPAHAFSGPPLVELRDRDRALYGLADGGQAYSRRQLLANAAIAASRVAS